MLSMKRYKLIDHTADFGIQAWGKDLSELFVNAAEGMFNLIADISKVKPAEKIEISLESSDENELLRNWLAELLYYRNNKNMLLCKFKVHKITGKSIVSTAEGELIDEKRHTLLREVKAVTFHQLDIKKEGSLLTTNVIFDV